jgi:hypothetical protein
MTWQDVVIAVGQFVFAAALIPSVRGRQKPALTSSLITATGLTVFGICFATLGLWLSVAGVWTSAAMWWVLAWQVRTAPAVVSLDEALAWGKRFEAMAHYEEEDEYPPTCPRCKCCSQTWQHCWNGCDDGEIDRFDDDPLWYVGPARYQRCDICEGKGGWYDCDCDGNGVHEPRSYEVAR